MFSSPLRKRQSCLLNQSEVRPSRSSWLLMVGVLQNTSLAGVYTLHAEPGAGKSTAATLAALELKERQPKDVIVLLQNDLERQLKSFFRLSNIEYTAEITRPLFTNLKDKGIRVRLANGYILLDNVLDGGTISAQSGDRLSVLARAANDNQQSFTGGPENRRWSS